MYLNHLMPVYGRQYFPAQVIPELSHSPFLVVPWHETVILRAGIFTLPIKRSGVFFFRHDLDSSHAYFGTLSYKAFLLSIHTGDKQTRTTHMILWYGTLLLSIPVRSRCAARCNNYGLVKCAYPLSMDPTRPRYLNGVNASYCFVRFFLN